MLYKMNPVSPVDMMMTLVNLAFNPIQSANFQYLSPLSFGVLRFVFLILNPLFDDKIHTYLLSSVELTVDALLLETQLSFTFGFSTSQLFHG